MTTQLDRRFYRGFHDLKEFKAQAEVIGSPGSYMASYDIKDKVSFRNAVYGATIDDAIKLLEDQLWMAHFTGIFNDLIPPIRWETLYDSNQKNPQSTK